MPLGNLRTETIVGEKVIDGDDMNLEVYGRNSQQSDKKRTPILQPLQTPKQVTVEKAKAAAKTTKAKRTKADSALENANKKDLNKRNIK